MENRNYLHGRHRYGPRLCSDSPLPPIETVTSNEDDCCYRFLLRPSYPQWADAGLPDSVPESRRTRVLRLC